MFDKNQDSINPKYHGRDKNNSKLIGIVRNEKQ